MATNPNPKPDPKPEAAPLFEVIQASEVRRVPRGRKSNVDPALVTSLRTLKAGQVVRISGMACTPGTTDYGKDKARVGATLRSALKAAGFQAFKIEWSPEGVPQVTIKS